MKKILVKGNIVASKHVTSYSYPLEGYYEAHCEDTETLHYDMVIEGDLNIKGISVVSDDMKVFATGEIMVIN